MTPRRWFVPLLVVWCSLCSAAQAGMPSFTLEDIPRYWTLAGTARARIEAISFFLAGVLLSALLVQWTWNALRRDFPRLPRLGYGRSLGLVGLWGTLFLLVLTMISGARELMTPGAWRKEGHTYALVEDVPAPTAPRVELPPQQMDVERQKALARLWRAIEEYYYYRENELAYLQPELAPLSYDTPPPIAEKLWIAPGTAGERYVYNPESVQGFDDATILVSEPESFGPGRWVLMWNGTVRRLSDVASSPVREDVP